MVDVPPRKYMLKNAKVYTEDMEESDKSHASCSGETYMTGFFQKGVEHFFTENGSTMEG